MPTIGPGQKFGRLTTLQRGQPDPHRHRMWEVLCDCGTQLVVLQGNLKAGFTQSCGCMQKELAAAGHRTHGQGAHGQRTAEYKTWLRIKHRCNNPKSKDYAKYGAKGITVCERWAASFEAFFADMGSRPSATHSIDRINSEGPYSPDNCRWATSAVQGANRRSLRYVILDGKRMFLREAEKAANLALGRISAVASIKKISHQLALEYCLAAKQRAHAEARP